MWPWGRQSGPSCCSHPSTCTHGEPQHGPLSPATCSTASWCQKGPIVTIDFNSSISWSPGLPTNLYLMSLAIPISIRSFFLTCYYKSKCSDLGVLIPHSVPSLSIQVQTILKIENFINLSSKTGQKDNSGLSSTIIYLLYYIPEYHCDSAGGFGMGCSATLQTFVFRRSFWSTCQSAPKWSVFNFYATLWMVSWSYDHFLVKKYFLFNL